MEISPDLVFIIGIAATCLAIALVSVRICNDISGKYRDKIIARIDLSKRAYYKAAQVYAAEAGNLESAEQKKKQIEYCITEGVVESMALNIVSSGCSSLSDLNGTIEHYRQQQKNKSDAVTALSRKVGASNTWHEETMLLVIEKLRKKRGEYHQSYSEIPDAFLKRVRKKLGLTERESMYLRNFSS